MQYYSKKQWNPPQHLSFSTLIPCNLFIYPDFFHNFIHLLPPGVWFVRCAVWGYRISMNQSSTCLKNGQYYRIWMWKPELSMQREEGQDIFHKLFNDGKKVALLPSLSWMCENSIMWICTHKTHTCTHPLTCSRHLMRSPGAMMAVVNTPDSIPAANSWGYLQDAHRTHSGEKWWIWDSEFAIHKAKQEVNGPSIILGKMKA